MPNILLGLSGSVASIKAWELYDLLSELGEVKVVATHSARHFLAVARPPPPRQHQQGLISESAEASGSDCMADHTPPIANGAQAHAYAMPATHPDQGLNTGSTSTSPPISHGPLSLNLPFPVLDDEDEWRSWQKVGDPVLHIELRRWADILVLAPCSANTLAKVANGLCDNLLTFVLRAWDFSRKSGDDNARGGDGHQLEQGEGKWNGYRPTAPTYHTFSPPVLARPVLIAPAMNTLMWTSPFTKRHLSTLEDMGMKVIKPSTKRLACGDEGVGAMAEPRDIQGAVKEALRNCGKT